mmetsp:Transcript_97081/g.172806  ORF Transcript_97081/g.172806 Transcript_97081/m.172806 type:complete len:183 (-) Transcript_97081:633-1181(-)
MAHVSTVRVLKAIAMLQVLLLLSLALSGIQLLAPIPDLAAHPGPRRLSSLDVQTLATYQWTQPLNLRGAEAAATAAAAAAGRMLADNQSTQPEILQGGAAVAAGRMLAASQSTQPESLLQGGASAAAGRMLADNQSTQPPSLLQGGAAAAAAGRMLAAAGGRMLAANQSTQPLLLAFPFWNP